MSKKHFIQFAAIAKGHVAAFQYASAKAVYYAVLQVNDNPQFDRDKFMKACGLTDDILAGKV
jgi:hypothetical protein